MDSLANTPGVNTGLDLIKQIGMVNPILALLLLLLLAIIYVMYRRMSKVEDANKELQKEKDTEIKELRDGKEAEVKGLNSILLQVREGDKEMLIELKNLIARFIEIEKEQSVSIKDGTEKVGKNTEILSQLSTKIDYLLTRTQP